MLDLTAPRSNKLIFIPGEFVMKCSHRSRLVVKPFRCFNNLADAKVKTREKGIKQEITVRIVVLLFF